MDRHGHVAERLLFLDVEKELDPWARDQTGPGKSVIRPTRPSSRTRRREAPTVSLEHRRILGTHGSWSRT